MKLRKEDKVMVIAGRDKGKTGVVMAVFPALNKVAVENVNMVKRHTKPSRKQPRGGILEIAKPIDVSKVMALDPNTNKPARIGYAVKADGSKERIFKVSRNQTHPAPKPEKAKKDRKSDKKEAPAAKVGAKDNHSNDNKSKGSKS